MIKTCKKCGWKMCVSDNAIEYTCTICGTVHKKYKPSQLLLDEIYDYLGLEQGKYIDDDLVEPEKDYAAAFRVKLNNSSKPIKQQGCELGRDYAKAFRKIFMDKRVQ